MSQPQEVVDSLKKVTIRIEEYEETNQDQKLAFKTEIEWIIGLGVEGWTHFENFLANRSAGEVIFVTLSPENLHETFGHLVHQLQFSELMRYIDTQRRFKISILTVSTPENREIVKAMAEMTACGCGCGCGGH